MYNTAKHFNNNNKKNRFSDSKGNESIETVVYYETLTQKVIQITNSIFGIEL